ncbi:aldo/keto reductase [Thermophilibacter sp. ET337]|uniref:aldo/keto reductase n=1 Tax=Thermophilibacter sp. ET337 TaxID=2973084 RepID=UPI0021ACFA3E|nr:aldo/keto reductase [Thermophilibacter sp. ET337]MCR8907082.1 aldo/keto reductase [Thermophilibacter sp. ET337]
MAEMTYTTLGHSGIKISRLCLGGMSFGAPSADFHQWTIGPEETRAVIARALELGVNFIDTANCYAHGTSEEYIGAALRELGIPRDQVVLASKVFFNEGGLSREAINREIDGTLQRLGTDYLDLYIIHRFDYETPMEETMEALDGLVRAGKVRALGASAMYAYQLHNMQVVAEKNGWTPFTSMQCHYNLLYREDEREMIPVCRQYDMALTPYSPLASGHLCRPTWESDSARSRTDVVVRNKYDADRERDMPIVARVAKLAERHDVPMSRIALAWHWARGVEAPIVGCSSPARVDDAVAALDVVLTAEEVAYLEEPYVAHELVGPAARPGEKPLAGTTNPNAK